MNIKPVFIEVNNFLSYHYQKLEIKDGLFFISGKNGGGKTSFFIESGSYCLFNKSMSGKKLGELVNKDNPKNMFVTILLNIDNKHILIERGESPKRFNIFVETNDVVDFKKKNRIKIDKSEYIFVNEIALKKAENEAENTDMQDWLEQKFLKMNHNDFITYVLKSRAKDLSYLEMPKIERDKYLENLFDLSTFRTMNDKIKLKISDQKIISDNNKELYDKSVNILHHENEKNEALEKMFDENNLEKISNIEKEITRFENDSEKIFFERKILVQNNIIDELNKKDIEFDFFKRKETIEQSIRYHESQIKSITEKYITNKDYDEKLIIQYNNDLSNLDSDLELNKIEITNQGTTLKKSIEQDKIILNNLKQDLLALQSDYDKLVLENNLKQESIDKQHTILQSNLMNNIKDIEEKKSNLNINDKEINEIVEQHKSEIKKFDKRYNNILTQIETTSDLLKQFKIVDKDSLNSEIGKILLEIQNRIGNKFIHLENFLSNFSETLHNIIVKIDSLENDSIQCKLKIDEHIRKETNALETLKNIVENQLKFNVYENEIKLLNQNYNETIKKEITKNLDIIKNKFIVDSNNFLNSKNLIEKNIQDNEWKIKTNDSELIVLREKYKALEVSKNKRFEEITTSLKNIQDQILKNDEMNLLNINNNKLNIEKENNNLIENEKNKSLANSTHTLNIEKENESLKLLKADREKRIEFIENEINILLNKIEEIKSETFVQENDNFLKLKNDVKFFEQKYNDEYNKYIRLDAIKNIVSNKYNIKIFIMEKFRNFLNKKICQYSSEFKVPCLPLFDENFDIKLNGFNYDELGIKSLSAGEIVKVSLSILFASNDVKQILYKHNNFQMMLFDEVMSNIDVESIYDVLRVLTQYSEKMFIGIIAHGFGEFTNEGKLIEIVKTEKNGSIII